MRVRFNERLDERTRMARELHDTFLQTVQGSKMVVEDALSPSAEAAKMRQALQNLSIWLTQAVNEARAALHALRVSTMERNHLSEALKRTTEDPHIPSTMNVSITTIGDARDLHPIVRDEIFRIAFEAIRNAAEHSKASRLEVEVRYARELSLRVTDNGVGIDPSISDDGKAGHFGLQGMRERAARIRGKLAIRSSANVGTEVALIIPGSVVYRTSSPGFLKRIRERLRDLFRQSDL
jgi:signal transduction histidine kinase